ncbi:MAG: NADH-quinone oxidoreductase subunit H [Clostridiales bacterium]|nr:NADH-quinone oxidoreductase subunit H [Clostridiales bacterium]
MLRSAIGIILYIICAPIIGGLLAGLDRKLTARMQGRIGPPLLQPFYDVSKLINKEILLINNMQYLFAWCFIIFVVFTGALFFGGTNLLLVFFVLTTAAMFLVLEAATTNSPYSVMGANREMIQMLSYEPMVLLTAVGFYLATQIAFGDGTFTISKIVSESQIPNIVYLPGVFIGFLYILTIKLRKSPFDISMSHHAHQEMVKGITTELSGGMLAIIEISHWYENVFLLGVISLFIVCSKWWSIPLAIVVVAAAFFLEILIDNTSARVKWDKMFKSAWAITMIFGAVNIFILQLI